MTLKPKPTLSAKDSVCPEVDFDPFADDMLEDPFEAYESLRAMSPVVKLKKYGC